MYAVSFRKFQGIFEVSWNRPSRQKGCISIEHSNRSIAKHYNAGKHNKYKVALKREKYG